MITCLLHHHVLTGRFDVVKNSASKWLKGSAPDMTIEITFIALNTVKQIVKHGFRHCLTRTVWITLISLLSPGIKNILFSRRDTRKVFTHLQVNTVRLVHLFQQKIACRNGLSQRPVNIDSQINITVDEKFMIYCNDNNFILQQQDTLSAIAL